VSEVDADRARFLGELVQTARLRAGRSREDCAQVLGVSPEAFGQMESGETSPSLPDLEILAMYLKVPMDHFWGGEQPPESRPVDYSGYVFLRQRIIGALLRQARIQARRSVEEVAAKANVSPSQVEAYEAGSEAIPFLQLEQIARYLDVPMTQFSDDRHGPLAQHEAEIAMQRRFGQLPPEMKAFVTEPINRTYLETAMRLSEMDVDRLRGIAEGILDITF
jgi:transcriptional regulator with XRE-family HTH domain